MLNGHMSTLQTKLRATNMMLPNQQAKFKTPMSLMIPETPPLPNPCVNGNQWLIRDKPKTQEQRESTTTA